MEVFLAIFNVILGVVLVWSGDWVKSQSRMKQDAHFSAIRLTPILNCFFDSCYAVAMDNGEEYGHKPGCYYKEKILSPYLTLPNDIIWQSIDRILLKEIVFLSTDLNQAEKKVSIEGGNSNTELDNGEVMAVRQFEYAQLAIKCDEVIRKLERIMKIDEGIDRIKQVNDCNEYIEGFRSNQRAANA